MLSFSNFLSIIFSFFMRLFVSWPLTGMIIISVITGVLMLIIYKYTSFQKYITLAKNRIKANFLAIMLFSDSFVVLIKSILSILKWNLFYMANNLLPLSVMMIPVLLLLIQLNFWYGYRAIDIGETALVTVEVDKRVSLYTADVELVSNGGVVIETKGLRVPKKGEVTWRIRGKDSGEFELAVKINGQTESKRIVIGKPGKLVRVAPIRHNGNFWDSVFYPGEAKLSGPIKFISIGAPDHDAAITGLTAGYTPVLMKFLWWDIHWIIVYFVLSIVAGLSMKGIFKVDI